MDTKDGIVIRKRLELHCLELHPKPKFLVMAEPPLSVMFGLNISDLFDYKFS